jgi:hypothetical protein
VPSFVNKIRDYLPPRWKFHESTNVDRLYSFIVKGRSRPGFIPFRLLYGDAEKLGRTCHDTELLEAFESDLNNYIARTTRTNFFVHAGVVEWKGRAIVMPGPSSCGKTTLVREFLKHGASYCSDEFALFDKHGYVSPFPKPLMIRKRSGRERVPPEELRCKIARERLPVGLVLFTTYQQSAVWVPKYTTAGQAVLGLLSNAFAARQQPGWALTVLKSVVCRARILSGVRGNARGLVRTVLHSGGWN